MRHTLYVVAELVERILGAVLAVLPFCASRGRSLRGSALLRQRKEASEMALAPLAIALASLSAAHFCCTPFGSRLVRRAISVRCILCASDMQIWMQIKQSK